MATTWRYWMADKIKPHVVERVKKIRQWEEQNQFKEARRTAGFVLYKNYYVPESIVNKARTLLSFGVGGNVGFEKEIAFANKDINIELFDPTPRSVGLINIIITRSSYKLVGDRNDSDINVQACKRIKFNPVAYSDSDGTLPFYYDMSKEKDEQTVEAAKQSFSLVKREGYDHVLVKTKTLKTIMADRNMENVDMLKADIEGLWWEFGNELLDNKINCPYVALELELSFEDGEKVEPALDKAQLLCDKFVKHDYDVFINRKREKLMLEMLFIKRGSYEG